MQGMEATTAYTEPGYHITNVNQTSIQLQAAQHLSWNTAKKDPEKEVCVLPQTPGTAGSAPTNACYEEYISNVSQFAHLLIFIQRKQAVAEHTGHV